MIPLRNEGLDNLLQGLEHGGQPRLEGTGGFRGMVVARVIGASRHERVNGDLGGHGLPVIGGLLPFAFPLFAVQIGLEMQVAVEIGVHAQVDIAHDARKIEFAERLLGHGWMSPGFAQ